MTSRYILFAVVWYLHSSTYVTTGYTGNTVVGIFDNEGLSLQFADVVNTYTNNETRYVTVHWPHQSVVTHGCQVLDSRLSVYLLYYRLSHDIFYICLKPLHFTSHRKTISKHPKIPVFFYSILLKAFVRSDKNWKSTTFQLVLSVICHGLW